MYIYKMEAKEPGWGESSMGHPLKIFAPPAYQMGVGQTNKTQHGCGSKIKPQNGPLGMDKPGAHKICATPKIKSWALKRPCWPGSRLGQWLLPNPELCPLSLQGDAQQ